MVLLAIGSFSWQKWFSYYWYTDELHLYQSDNSFRICGEQEELIPSWTQNEAYYRHVVKAEKAVADEQSISIVARGMISDTGKEVYIDNIIEIIVGTNAKCEGKH